MSSLFFDSKNGLPFDLQSMVLSYVPKEGMVILPQLTKMGLVQHNYSRITSFSEGTYLNRLVSMWPMDHSGEWRLELISRVLKRALQEIRDNFAKLSDDDWNEIRINKDFKFENLSYAEINIIGTKIQEKKDEYLLSFLDRIFDRYPDFKQAIAIPENLSLADQAKYVRNWLGDPSNQQIITNHHLDCRGLGPLPPESIHIPDLDFFTLRQGLMDNRSLDSLRLFIENDLISSHWLSLFAIDVAKDVSIRGLEIILSCPGQVDLSFVGSVAIQKDRLDLFNFILNGKGIVFLDNLLKLAVKKEKVPFIKAILDSERFTISSVFHSLSAVSHIKILPHLFQHLPIGLKIPALIWTVVKRILPEAEIVPPGTVAVIAPVVQNP